MANRNQYRYYHGILLYKIAEQLGHKPTKAVRDELHRFNKELAGIETTRGMSVKDKREFIFKVIEYWVVEVGLELPDSSDIPGFENMTLEEIHKQNGK